MNTGTIIYVKKDFLFKERVVFMGIVIKYLHGTYVYYFKGGRVKSLDITKLPYKADELQQLHLVEVDDIDRRRSLVMYLTTMVGKKNLKYTWKENLLIWWHELTHAEPEISEKVFKHNLFIYKADFIAFCVRMLFPTEIQKTVGVKAKSLIV